MAQSKHFSPGDYLFREGEPSVCMYLISKGTVSIRKEQGAAFVELAQVHANEVIGELSFFDRQPRSASAVAITEVDLVEIQFDALDKLYVNVPNYLKAIIASLADRLRKANELIRNSQKSN